MCDLIFQISTVPRHELLKSWFDLRAIFYTFLKIPGKCHINFFLHMVYSILLASKQNVLIMNYLTYICSQIIQIMNYLTYQVSVAWSVCKCVFNLLPCEQIFLIMNYLTVACFWYLLTVDRQPTYDGQAFKWMDRQTGTDRPSAMDRLSGERTDRQETSINRQTIGQWTDFRVTDRPYIVLPLGTRFEQYAV